MSEITKAEDFKDIGWRAIIQNIDKLSFREQVRLDMKVHDWYVERRPHSKKKTYLIPDKFIKYRLLDWIDGRKLNEQEIDELIYCLDLDRSSHIDNDDGKTWDKKWVEIYTNWIEILVKAKSKNKEAK
jgi:hypothetical protein